MTMTATEHLQSRRDIADKIAHLQTEISQCRHDRTRDGKKRAVLVAEAERLRAEVAPLRAPVTLPTNIRLDPTRFRAADAARTRYLSEVDANNQKELERGEPCGDDQNREASVGSA